MLIENRSLFYCVAHIRFSSFNYSQQLVDITVYETPCTQSSISKILKKNFFKNLSKKNSLEQSVLIYNFHSYYTQDRFYIFTQSLTNYIYSRTLQINNTLDSISELFFAANWLEREAAELFGIDFGGKKDSRNLMLQYGDFSMPFKKFFPTIGFTEVIYDIVRDYITKVNVNTQS